MRGQDKLQQAIDYFKAREGFHSLFLQLVDKYYSYGRFIGTITISNPSENEKKHLSTYTGKNYSRETEITLGVKKFIELLDKSNFGGIDLKELVEHYIGRTLVTKIEEEVQKKEEQELFFRMLDSEHEYVKLVQEAISTKKKGTRGIYELYQKDKRLLKEILENIYRSFQYFPIKGYIRLPFFASVATGNPHYFDLKMQSGKTFLQCLQIILSQTIEKEIISSPNTEEVTEIMEYFGVSRDDITNSVTVYGMIEKENGKETLFSQAINKSKKVLTFPLRELEELNEIDGVGKKVFVIENSGVYSSIIDECQKDQIDATILCSSGILNLSVWLLLEKFVDAGNIIYYSGDYDPEGILIATRLKKKFENSLIFWNFEKEAYLNGLSQENISPSRLKQLQSVPYKELEGLIQCMYEQKKCGYQEKQKDRLYEVIKNNHRSLL